MSDRLLDGISRILAAPVPRRRMVKMTAAGFGAAAAALFAGREARAECKKGEAACGDLCCKKDESCVINEKGESRCRKVGGSKWWTLKSGAAMAAAAGGGASGVYAVTRPNCRKNEIDCGTACCPPGHVCTSPGVCCPPGRVCGNLCCPPGQFCYHEGATFRCVTTHPSVSG